MRCSRFWIAGVCIVALTVGAWGQNDAAKAAPEPVVGHIPADAMGYVLIGNLKTSMTHLQDYLAAIGLEGTVPPDLLGMVTGMLQLGQEFDANGGVAFVMLDPAKFKIDLLAMAGLEDPDAADEAAEEPKLPLVAFVPGKSIQGVFGAYEPADAESGKSKQIMLPPGPIFARQMGGYVALSPLEEALDAVAAAKKRVAANLSPQQVKILADADFAVHLNMKVVNPVFGKMTARLKKQIAGQEADGRMPTMPAKLITKLLDLLGGTLGQVDDAVITVRLNKQAAVIDELVAFRPDSVYGKILAATVTPKAPLLHRLPDKPYVFALGAHGGGEKAEKLSLGMANSVLKDFVEDEEMLARINALMTSLSGQVRSVQIVAGGAPQGAGVFAVACIWECEDSARLQADVVKSTDLVKDVFLSLLPEEALAEAKGLELKLSKGVAQIGPLTVDALEVTHPEMAEQSDREKETMGKVLGEQKIRILLAAPSKTTLIATFGGTEKFLADAIKTAGGTGTIPGSKGVKTVMKMLPANPSAVMLFNVANLFKVIIAGAEIMGEEPPPFEIASETPIAVATAIRGSSTHSRLLVPNDLVKELVEMYLSMMGGGPDGPGSGPDPYEGGGGEDF